METHELIRDTGKLVRRYVWERKEVEEMARHLIEEEVGWPSLFLSAYSDSPSRAYLPAYKAMMASYKDEVLRQALDPSCRGGEVATALLDSIREYLFDAFADVAEERDLVGALIEERGSTFERAMLTAVREADGNIGHGGYAGTPNEIDMARDVYLSIYNRYFELAKVEVYATI